MSDQDEDGFDITKLRQTFSNAYAYLVRFGYHPETKDQALSLRVTADATGKRDLAKNARIVEQLWDVVSVEFEEAENEDEF